MRSLPLLRPQLNPGPVPKQGQPVQSMASVSDWYAASTDDSGTFVQIIRTVLPGVELQILQWLSTTLLQSVSTSR